MQSARKAQPCPAHADGADHAQALQAVAPLEANPFLERWALDAALEHLADAAEIDVLPLGDCVGSGPALPLVRLLKTPPGIGPVWSVWDHIHCFDTTPPVRGADAGVVLDTVFGALARKRASLLRWSGLPTDTPFYRELLRYLRRAGLEFELTRSRARPVLLAEASPDRTPGLRCGRRTSELRRRRRRLEEAGRLDVRAYRGPHDAGLWMDGFLELEASGWKGAHGTAIACKPNERAFFERLMGDAAARDKALVCSIELDGRPIAMTVNLRAGSGVWGFKTAYDDGLARFSPGALVVHETTAQALREPSVAWVDSCMEDDGGPAGALWRDRRQVVDLLIAASPSNNWLPQTASRALGAFRFARQKVSPLFGQVRRGPRAQALLARWRESRMSRIVIGITSIVVLPEMPTVVLMTASI